ncbi:CppA N-terminal domain-containing protein [Streptococcus pluranimalium]|uniref:CppA N-terminal domain-containing protein n=1 Tax=Streptococcus pluranimalium TaxID=82348 RepID=UPI0039FC5AE4
MSLFKDVTFISPVIRVEERDLNLEFLQKNLGMKLVSEENALAFLSGHASKEIRFTIEESPTYRTRAVEGTKKLNCLVIKAQASEIAQLLARGAEARHLFKGKEGYAFETVSPQGDAILIHSEEAIEDLEQVTSVEVDLDPEFKGLSDFHVEEVVLNVPDSSASQAFYQDVFEGNLPFKLTFETAEGPDLTIEPQITWDIEFFEFQVPEEYDLVALYDYLVDKGLSPYIDKKARVVVVSDPSNIEIWFTK